MDGPIILIFAGSCPPFKPRAAYFAWRIVNFPEREDESICDSGLAKGGKSEAAAALAGLVAGLEWLTATKAAGQLPAEPRLVLHCQEPSVLWRLIYGDEDEEKFAGTRDQVRTARRLLSGLGVEWRAEDPRWAGPELANEYIELKRQAIQARKDAAA